MFMASFATPTLRSVFVTGLQNAHALEQQALTMIDRQLDRIVNYPEIAERLRSHRMETEQQMARVNEILHSLNSSNSSLKDMALNFMGNMAALGNVMAADEILKDQMINYAFENFEVASYRSLIAMAEAGDFTDATSLLRETLAEEEAMAAWVLDSLPELTMKYVRLRSAGRTADR
jgi:ferritin-like metal-binding protein YciE